MAPRRAPGQVSLGSELLTSHARITSASPDQVWQVLSNGWLFTRWAIGATPVCGVDDDWPNVGSRLHHAIGRGRLAIRTQTQVLASTPAQRLQLRTEGWPCGSSELVVTLEPAWPGTNLQVDELVVTPDYGLGPTVHNVLLQWRITQASRGLDLLAREPEP